MKMSRDLHASTGNRQKKEGQEYKLQVTKWGKISMENKTDRKN